MTSRLKLSAVLSLFCLLLAIPVFSNSSQGQGKRELCVAMCQIICLDGDRSGNFARIENAIREAKNAGADIVCFPETSLLGWVNPEAHRRAYPIPGKDSDRLCRMAAGYGIHMCIGLAEKEGNLLFDTVILIDDTGDILLKHRKINILTKLMTPPYTVGKGVRTVETKFGRIGLLICADTFKQEILTQMREKEPDFVLVPYGWAAEEDRWPEHGKELLKTVSQAALAIGAPVVGVDLVGEITHGPWTGMTYGGQSVAADAQGKIIAIAKDRDRDVMIVRVRVAPDRLPYPNKPSNGSGRTQWQ